MFRQDHPEIALETIRATFLRDELISEEQFRALLALCSHPAGNLREVALSLLLHPPVTDILSSYRHLLGFLATGGKTLRELPPAVGELLCEVVAVIGQRPQDPAVALFIERALRHLPPALMRTLLGQSLPLKPFLGNLHLSSMGVTSRQHSPALKRRWRLLRKRLLTGPCAAPWSELSLTDLGCLFGRKRSTRRSRYPSGAWLVLGRPLILSLADPITPPISMFLPHCTWGWVDTGGRRFMNRLMSAHIEELREVRALAETVGCRTRRVVLSWHNATLAASSGWAFDDLSAQFPSSTLWKSFQKAVQGRLRHLQGAPPHGLSALGDLCDQWRRRLVIPKIHLALWQKRLAGALDLTRDAEWRKDLELVERALGPCEPAFSSACKGYGWPGPVSPHQRLALPAILGWSVRQESTWHDGLLRLAGLLQEGQRLLDEGLLPHLVLPWIDKFFISSRREADWEYLTGLVGWLAGLGLRPLILFWEDTPHRQEPSLKLVLKRLHGQGHPFRGIGVFDSQSSSRTEALEIMCRDHQEVMLFALRPYRDCHNLHSFQQLLENRPYRFFQDYDSSWKDGLYFLYAGTQVFPLLAAPTDRENVPAWVAGEGSKYPFGVYWRSRLRAALSGKRSGSSDAFSLSYAMWANLC